MIILPILFFVTAILYSSVGFGGGSTYLALLLIWEIPYYILPVIALGCNIIVVSGNSINYIKYQNYIISTLNNLFQLTLFTRDKYYGMGCRNMFNLQFYNYVLFYEKGLIHEKNLITLLQEIVSLRRENKRFARK